MLEAALQQIEEFLLNFFLKFGLYRLINGKRLRPVHFFTNIKRKKKLKSTMPIVVYLYRAIITVAAKCDCSSCGTISRYYNWAFAVKKDVIADTTKETLAML